MGQNTFTAIFEKHEAWYIAYAAELPGANTQGRTLDEARENLRDAIGVALDANRDLAAREANGS